MNKKILAVVLTLVMVMSMLSGCGSAKTSSKKDSTYFKEVQELCKITKGTSTATFDIVADMGEGSDDVTGTVAGFVQNDEGKLAVSIKMEIAEENENEVGAKIYAKLGKDTDFAELTTLVLSDNKLYVTVDPIIAFVKKIDENTATQLEASLAQMGISGAASIDLKQIAEAANINFDMESTQKQSQEFMNKFFAAAETHFADLQGQDGSDYTLTVNGDNAEAAVTDVINFLKSDDAKELIDEYQKIVTSAYGKEMVEQMLGTASLDDIVSQLPDAAKKVEENKDDAVKAIKDAKMNIVSKASLNNGEGKISLDTGDIESDGQSFKMAVDCTVKEETPDVKSMIPENASDVTTLLLTVINSMGGLTGESSAE